MRTPSRSTLLTSLLALVLLASCASGPSPAASVDGEPITDEDVAHGASLFRFLATLQQQPCGQIEPGSDETEASACNRLALTNLIEFEVTNTYAAENDIEADGDALDAALEGLDGQFGAEQVDAGLEAESLTRDDLRELARNFVLLRDVAAAITAEELDDAELRTRYEQDLAAYTTIDVDHILVETQREADDVYDQVTQQGSTREDFQALAKEISIDPSAQENSGALGEGPAANYVPEFANAAVALEPGEISEPVQTDFGWHVIRLQSAQVTPFEQVRDGLVEQTSVEVFADWLRDQLGTDRVEVNPSYGRFDLETLSVQRISATDPDASPSVPADEGPVNVPEQP
jgi:parvulin-like peptidyl-prolyl isomerase